MKLKTIYTVGYYGKTPEDLHAMAVENDATILDIRFSPWSRSPEWQSRNLRFSLGDKYSWCKSFGNENYKGTMGPDVILHDEDHGLRVVGRIYSEGGAVILMCGCPNYHKCHRKEVAELCATAMDAEIVELHGHSPPWQREQYGLEI